MNCLSLFLIFSKIGLFAFGGRYTIIALARSAFIEKRKWLTEEELTDYLALSQTIPGLISVNFAAFLGNKKAGFFGGVAAVLGMVFPAVIAILALAQLIKEADKYPVLQHALSGVRIAVAVLIFNMVVSQARITIKSKYTAFLAIISFLFIFYKFSPIIPLLLATTVGLFFYRKTGRIFK